MDQAIFEDIGLTKREIKVYLSLLELGSSTIGIVLEKTQIPSSKIYEILNRLKDKGLVSYVKKENKRYYQASDPDTILNYIDDKRKKISEILPILLEKQKYAHDRQSVELFEGKKAIFNLLRNLIKDGKKGEQYLAFTHGDEHEEEDIFLFYHNFVKRRLEKGLDLRLVIRKKYKKLLEELYTKEMIKKINARFSNFNFPKGITIFRDSVILVTWKNNPTAIKIESEQISRDFKEFFEELWGKARG